MSENRGCLGILIASIGLVIAGGIAAFMVDYFLAISVGLFSIIIFAVLRFDALRNVKILWLIAFVILGAGIIQTSVRINKEQKALDEERAHIQAIIDPALKVCESNAVAEAKGFDETTNKNHPMVIFLNGENITPTEWLPQNLSDLELVICIEKIEDEIETCEYSTLGVGLSTHKIIRKHEVASYMIYDARSGIEVDRFTEESPSPRECSETETFTDGQFTKELRSRFSNDDITTYLERYFTSSNE